MLLLPCQTNNTLMRRRQQVSDDSVKNCYIVVNATLGSRTGQGYVLAVQLDFILPEYSVPESLIFRRRQIPESHWYSILLSEDVAAKVVAKVSGLCGPFSTDVFLPDARRIKQLPVCVSMPPKSDSYQTHLSSATDSAPNLVQALP